MAEHMENERLEQQDSEINTVGSFRRLVAAMHLKICCLIAC